MARVLALVLKRLQLLRDPLRLPIRARVLALAFRQPHILPKPTIAWSIALFLSHPYRLRLPIRARLLVLVFRRSHMLQRPTMTWATALELRPPHPCQLLVKLRT